jgi:hypothetical protein
VCVCVCVCVRASVCACVRACLGISCVRKSQAISTKLGMEAQNVKGKVEFVCGINRILTSGFMSPSWILAYYSIDRLALATSLSVTFEPLDRFFRNLVANFGPTRAITRHVQIYKNLNLVRHFQVLHFLVLHFQRPQFYIAPGDQTGLGRYPRSIERISS